MKLARIASKTASTGQVHERHDDGFDLAYRLETAVWIFDIDNARVLKANAAACGLWMAGSEQELAARDMRTDMSPTVAQRLRQYQSDFIESDAAFNELWTIYPNGLPRSVMVVYRGHRLADGRMAMKCEVVGESVDSAQNLRSAEALLHTDVMIMLFSREGPSLYFNPAARRFCGGSEIAAIDVFEIPADLDAIVEVVETQGEHRGLYRLSTVSGSGWFDLSVKGCSDAATGEPALLLTAIDVSELKEARDTARHLANRDQLTNLHNRSYLQSHLDWMEETNAATGATVIVFDVDRFKQINDRHGHNAGDTVLRQIAMRTRAALEPDDLLARLGGDEFVIILPGPHDPVAATRRVERVRRAVAVPISHGEIRLEATISVGMSHITKTSTQFTKVIREADIALYHSKNAGRDQLTVFDADMSKAVDEREKLEIALKSAVLNEEFVLHYQPRLDLGSGQITGLEGLVRWDNPQAGLVSPDDFITVCEETGLIDELGRMVLEMGCAQAIAWRRQGLSLTLSLNVSPRQFADDEFLRCLDDLARQDGFPKGQIELEVTENVLIGDPLQIAEKLRRIVDMGYLIAIDDFGTGYSNLSYISQFPLHCLKIDRSFISQLPTSGPIVQLILTLGQQIGAKVVSEGVETAEQLQWLADRQCTEIQGFTSPDPCPPPIWTHFCKAFLRRIAHGRVEN
ncbi:putative bifunctional diguanylate cyclase/phosphodiesterase [Pseudooctadecabacter sp.]|uniref:putative bifunctional diguanylate cyclase/phosphodiesterase n=1 Tax=Pseudooctadecabacter sp. TaxID=1966338 RepID=UPI003F6C0249